MHEALNSATQTASAIKILCFMEWRSNITAARLPEAASQPHAARCCAGPASLSRLLLIVRAPQAVSPKRSPVEGIKENSRQLRGTIATDLAKDVDHFGEADKQLLKFHGSYQQEDRDARKSRHKDGLGKYYMFMVRCKIPGGRMTERQYLAMDDLAGARLHAAIRREPDSTLNSLGLRKHCATRLARTEMPSTIEIGTEPLPKTSIGKVDRKRVLAQLKEMTHANG